MFINIRNNSVTDSDSGNHSLQVRGYKSSEYLECWEEDR